MSGPGPRLPPIWEDFGLHTVRTWPLLMRVINDQAKLTTDCMRKALKKTSGPLGARAARGGGRPGVRSSKKRKLVNVAAGPKAAVTPALPEPAKDAKAVKRTTTAPAGEIDSDEKPSQQPKSPPKRARVSAPAGASTRPGVEAQLAAPAKTAAARTAARQTAGKARASKIPRKKPAALVEPASALRKSEANAPAQTAGQRFVLGPASRSSPGGPTRPLGLPVSYGTGRLLLVARDPHWLCAQWDASPDQVRQLNSLPRGVFPELRIYCGHGTKRLLRNIPVVVSVTGRGTWFVEVEQCGETYMAEIGYPDSSGGWVCLAGSPNVRTPPEAGSVEGEYEVTTIHPDLPIPPVVGKARETSAGAAGAVVPVPIDAPKNTTGLQVPVDVPFVHPVGSAVPGGIAASFQPSSAASLSSLARPFGEHRRGEVQSGAAPGAIAAIPSGAAPVSSGAFAEDTSQPKHEFWLNVNVELVVYGATVPDAKLVVAGRPVNLRADGSFSLRFALPDGQYGLSVEATSGRADDKREARLQFQRLTEYFGRTEIAPQDPALKPPPRDRER